jgi:hypothetical protein
MYVEVANEKSHDPSWVFDMLYSNAKREPDNGAAFTTANIRAVGFIAKPDKANDVTTCMRGPLVKLLRQAPGFTGAMILHSHQERRSVMVLTFWETERQATHTCWEEFVSVRRLLAPLVDVCSRVQTFQGTFPEKNGNCGGAAEQTAKSAS